MFGCKRAQAQALARPQPQSSTLGAARRDPDLLAHWHLMYGRAGWEEPCGRRLSRTVLSAPEGGTPSGDSTPGAAPGLVGTSRLAQAFARICSPTLLREAIQTLPADQTPQNLWLVRRSG